VGEGNGAILILDPADLRVLAEWPGHVEGGLSTEVIAIAWSPDGTQLASGGLDFALRIWDAATGAPLAVLRATTYARNDINGVAWSPDGRRIATAGQDGYVRLWDPAERVEVRSFRVSLSWARGVSWSPDGTALATSGAGGRLAIWDPQTGALLAALSERGPDVWAVAFSPDGTKLASGSGRYESRTGNSPIRIWGLP
jgi:WD40 repeat protein